MGFFYLKCECGATLKVVQRNHWQGKNYGVSNTLCRRCLQARRSSARPESERLIRRLHLLDITGQHEVPEANIIRDRLVELDRYLTPEDLQAIERISVELWAEYDRSKGRESPKTQEETDWLTPITSEELDDWEKLIKSVPRYEPTLSDNDMLRLIAEVRALRGHLYPPTVMITDRETDPALESR